MFDIPTRRYVSIGETCEIIDLALEAMVTGFGYAFLAAALLTVMGIIFTAFIRERFHCSLR
ncbi:MAG: hypothetical protein WA364_21295 [Candidatus Nitrosopolaris sp.]|jgi:hypothetical protein|nr:hypothetical protein [Candidatus Bathyarchaeia archaeon]HYA84101.1 hypothetical protein [Candidatus Bathyarchaeia archaeon]